MERVWKRVQSAGRRVGSAGRCGCPAQPCQLHVEQRAKRGTGSRKSRGPQTIVCGCQVQPCPVHPVLIRVRRTQRPPLNCDCPPESQPCPHAPRPAGPRRLRRCYCTEKLCRHVKRRPQGTTSILSINPIPASNDAAACAATNICECREKADCEANCECGAKPCSHTIKTRRTRRACDCVSQPCPHKPVEGRIKRVKYRVRQAGCAMARCTAELTMLHLHWELASECAPCRPRGLTRRLCRRQQSDNELYRSNSFKFERFERNKDECPTPQHKQFKLIKKEGKMVNEILHQYFNHNSICPICLINTENKRSFTCRMNHILCFQCSRYYHACPTCSGALFSNDFLHLNVQIHHQLTPSDFSLSDDVCDATEKLLGTTDEDSEDMDYLELISCPYTSNGCWAKFPLYLETIHVSRCQFRPYLEDEHLPTDLYCIKSETMPCKYKTIGCDINMPMWRKEIHENECIYRNTDNNFMKYENDINLCECKYKNYGCMVRMRLRRKDLHEQKCIYKSQVSDASGKNTGSYINKGFTFC